jgi:16S rRNA (cytidine1402-2'-O)-methyltransferase
MLKGEFVLVLEGARARTSGDDGLTPEQQRVLRLCLQQCSVRTAAKLAAEITGGRRELFYRAALAISRTQPANTQH